MNNLEEIINKYKLQYNKDKSYFKFNFQYEYNAQYFTFKNYIKQCNTNIKIINIINICNKIPIDMEDFIPIYEFLKNKSKNNKIVYYLDEKELLIRFSRICAGAQQVIFYNIPIFIVYNGSPVFSDFFILDICKLNRLLNNFSDNKKCNVCYETYIRGHYCGECFNNICVDCFYKLRSDTCPFCRTEF